MHLDSAALKPTNHLDIEGLDALMDALNKWNGGEVDQTRNTVQDSDDIPRCYFYFPRLEIHSYRCQGVMGGQSW
jgi:hypothetical protein